MTNKSNFKLNKKEAPKNSNSRQISEHPFYGFEQDRGKEIEIHFIDNTKIKGKLLFTGRYEIFIQKDNKELTIYKSSVKYIITNVHDT